MSRPVLRWANLGLLQLEVDREVIVAARTSRSMHDGRPTVPAQLGRVDNGFRQVAGDDRLSLLERQVDVLALGELLAVCRCICRVAGVR